MTTKELVETYYQGLAKKHHWDSVISHDFRFMGGDMTKTTPVIGKQAYIEIINKFARLFTDVRVKEMIVGDGQVCVIANYDYVFPSGKTGNGDVAEIWKIKDGKLAALTIFFDTLTFRHLLEN